MAGRYNILEELGSGGAGAVYKAFDTQLDRHVAIKRLLSREDAEKDTENSARLQKEAASLATLQHPNIVSVFDIASDEKGFFMVMELLEGETLADWIEKHPIGIKDFYELATQTLEAVLTAHHQSILHRDIKPENIKITRLPGGRLQAKILDFGLARIMKGASRKMTEDQDGNVTGSIYYMAPEQLQRKPVDERTDLYALGCVFYHALAGRRPFDAETLTEVIDMHVYHQVHALETVAPQVPSAIAEWVMWLINVDPDTRPANAQAALDFLKQLHQLGWFKTAEDEEIAIPILEEPEIVAIAMPLEPAGSALPNAPLPALGSKMHRVDPNHSGSPISASPAYSTTTLGPAGEPPVSMLGTIKSADPIEPPKAGMPKWILPVGLLALGTIVGGLYYNSKKAEEAAVLAEQTKVAAVVRPSNLLSDGNVVNYIAGKQSFISAEAKANGEATSNQSIGLWEDAQALAGNAALKTPDNKPESQPVLTRDAWSGEARPLLSFLSFDTGHALISRIDKKAPESKVMPFGASTKSKGVTIVTVIKPKLSDKPVHCFQLRNQDNKASLTFTAAPKGEALVTVEVGKNKKEVRLKSVDWTKLNLVTVTWNGSDGRVSLTVRNSSGTGSKVDGPGVKYQGPDPLNEVKFSGIVPNQSFYGDLVEFSVWNLPMRADERSLQEWRYAQYYFTKPEKRF